MKTFWIILAVAGFTTLLAAQEGKPKKPQPERGPTVIDSQAMEFKYDSRTVVYTGNVKVTDAQMQITCELLTARFMTNSSKLEIESIIAETNVVIDAIDWGGDTNHATADKLVYAYSVVDSVTNQTIELSGNPKLTNPKGGISGKVILVDLVKSKVFARDQTTTIQADAVKSLGEELDGKKKQPDNKPSPATPK